MDSCYVCEENHIGSCPLLENNIVPNSLDPDTIKQYDYSRDGDLNINDTAPDGTIYDIENETFISLYQLINKDKPYVLNFGSYTWYPFTYKSQYLMEPLYQKYKEYIDFITIYIEEAHPIDGWFVFNNLCIEKPKNLRDKIIAARKYKEETNTSIPIVVDMIDNELEKLYAAWPERIYVIDHYEIKYKSDKGPFGYCIEELDNWLKSYIELIK